MLTKTASCVGDSSKRNISNASDPPGKRVDEINAERNSAQFESVRKESIAAYQRANLYNASATYYTNWAT